MPGKDSKPVFVLHGNDEFLHSEHRKLLIKQLIGDSDPQTAVSSFDSSAELPQVLDELRTLPFLAPHRVVVITNADAFIGTHRVAIENYLNSPSGHSTLILSVTTWKKGTRLYKLVAHIGEAISCSAPRRADIAGQIRKLATKRDKQISPEAVELLLEWIADDVGSIANEVEKLSVYTGDRKEINAEDVAEIVTATAGPEAFALTNAITVGNIPSALKALAGSVTRRGEEFKTLGMLAWHLRKAIRIQQAMAAGARPQQACEAAGVPRYRGREFLGMLSRRPLRQLERDFRRLQAADVDMKTGGDPEGALQLLVAQLCS